MKMPRRSAIDNSKDHVYFRPELNSFPPIRLPVYPRSTGLFTPLPGNLEIVKAGEKNFVQVFWVTAGRMKMNFNGRIEFLYPGYVVYSLPQEPYSIEISPDGCQYRWVTFDGPDAAKFMLSFGYPRSAFQAGECPSRHFVNFEEHLMFRTPYSWRRMFCEICNILTIAGGTMDSMDTDNQKLYEILIYCREHFEDSKLNIKTLAEEFKLNRTTLLRIFREKMNTTPSEYLSLLRLQRALSLLHDPRFNIAEIAGKCGFRDCNYFCRFIKQNTGKRPSHLR